MTSNVQNSVRNSIFAIVLRILNIVFPFVTRTIIIRTLGLAYVGVSGLFTSIFGVLSIAELGVGSALLQALYIPIKNNDKSKIKAILNYYRKAYCIIGCVIMLLGIVLMPGLHLIIKEGSYPQELNIYIIYILNLVGTLIGYFVYSYKSLLLEAEQRGSDANLVRIVILIVQACLQIPILIFTQNYYLYLSFSTISTLVSTLSIAKVCDRRFPDYSAEGTISSDDKKIFKSKISALFLYKIGSTVTNNVDGIVISAVLGATILGAYNNYYLIVSSVSALIMVCYTAILPSVGHGLINKNKEQIYDQLMTSMEAYSWLIGWCSICLACLLTPFIQIWAGEESNFGIEFAIVFGLYFYFWRMQDPVSMYKDALGLWNRDKWRPLVAACTNLIFNLILVQFIGLYGILISTIISIVTINFPLSVKVLVHYLNRSSRSYFINTVKLVLLTLGIGAITLFICQRMSVENSYISFLIKMFICLIIPNILYLVILRKNKIVNKCVEILKQKLKIQSNANHD